MPEHSHAHTMSVLDKVLALRPTNAVSKLGSKSRLPLLNPRDLVRALEADPVSLLCVQVPALEEIPGLLRAARDQDAAIGFACAHPFPKRNTPTFFFDAVRAAGDEIEHKRPFFLQAGPVRVTTLEQKTLEMAAAEVFKFVDAGFSLISLDTSALGPEDSVRIAAGLSKMAVERELSIEIAAPLEAGSRPTPEMLRQHLEALAKKGLEPKFIRLKSTAILPLDAQEAEGDFAALRELQTVASERGAFLSIEERGSPLKLLSSWTAAGVKKVDVGQPFARPVLSALARERQDELRAKAEEAGIGLAEAIGRTDAPLAALDAEAKEKVEALAYGEAYSVLESFGAAGSGTKAMKFLADQSGY